MAVDGLTTDLLPTKTAKEAMRGKAGLDRQLRQSRRPRMGQHSVVERLAQPPALLIWRDKGQIQIAIGPQRHKSRDLWCKTDKGG